VREVTETTELRLVFVVAEAAEHACQIAGRGDLRTETAAEGYARGLPA